MTCIYIIFCSNKLSFIYIQIAFFTVVVFINLINKWKFEFYEILLYFFVCCNSIYY